MTTINLALLDAAIEDAAIGANGLRHDQKDWLAVTNRWADDGELCGTAMCLAGFAAVRAGAEVPKPKRGVHGDWYMPHWTLDPETGRLDEGGVHVSSFALERLGLTGNQADILFAATNSLNSLRAMRDHLREHPDADFDALMDVRNANL